MDKVVLGLSGGVDSAVAAHLLRESGLEVYGLYLDNGLPGADAAREAAASLSVPLTIADSREAMEQYVCTPFAEAYLRGETPNPCILCNPAVKFRALLDEAERIGAKYIATGHYARAENGAIYRGQPENDQSYMLCRLTPDEVNALLLPLAPYKKTEVRALAEELGLPVAHKPDSMDICFIPDGDYAAFLERYTGQPMQPGNFVDEQGHVIGRHKGAARYTIGQRKGLGISAETRLFVSGKNMAENTVTVGLESALFHSSLLADEWNWIAAPPAVGQPLPCTARTRYHQPERPATATLLPDGRVRVDFAAPQRAIAPGQAVVLYNGESVIGGGTILNVE